MWAWGSNVSGQLGVGEEDIVPHPAPEPVVGLSNVVAIEAGNFHSLALREDGTVWAWGANASGQLGIGERDFDPHPAPEPVVGLSNVVAIRAGAFHSLALREDGTVWAWGTNASGQLGIGEQDFNPHPAPEPVVNLTDVVAIDAGAFHSFALREDGTVWAWGTNASGQLGLGERDFNPHPAPEPVVNLTDMVAIGAGAFHGLALREDGTVWAWGINAAGQLGLGERDFDPHPVPGPVEGLPAIESIEVGGFFNLVLARAGSVWAWGSNGRGQLGVGDATSRAAPAQVLIPDGFTVEQLAAADQTSAANRAHSLAVLRPS